jgi:glutathione S-transferase
MSIVLYYAPMSSATRVYWALEELGVPFDKVRIDLSAGEQRKPDFLELNPNGKVPTMIVDGQPLFESLAMLLHLGEAYGVDKGLFPPSGRARLEALKWMAWGSVTLAEAVQRFMRNTDKRWPREQQSVGAAEVARKELGELMRILDGALAGRAFLLGENFSLADCGVATLAAYIGRIGIDLSPYANVSAWLGRCMARPALGRALAA